MAIHFEIIPRDWHKRRQPIEMQQEPVSVQIPDYEQTHNHICKMIVTYSDNSEKQLIGRVIFNQLAGRWTVDGMELAVKVVDK